MTRIKDLGQGHGGIKIMLIVLVSVIVFSIFISNLPVFFPTYNELRYQVQSESMIPTLQVGDVVLIDKSFPFENIRMDDIIFFSPPSDENKTIIHRVFLISSESPKTLTTKGDNNNEPTPGTDFPITEKEYIGILIDINGEPYSVDHCFSDQTPCELKNGLEIVMPNP